MREDVLPVEFAGLTGKVHNVRRKTFNEYSSSCPFCGGTDRFIMLIKSDRTGMPMGFCRQCDKKWWNESNDLAKLSPEELMELDKRREAENIVKELERARIVSEFTAERPWERYHANLNELAINEYAKRGIGEYWIEYWKLGFLHDREYFGNNGSFHSPSLTIPIMRPVSREVSNVKHRLTSPYAEHKYAYDRKGLPKELFVCDLDRPLSGSVMLIEGEFKAMTTYITLDDPSYNAVGIPSATPDLAILDVLKDCDPIYVILDPDAMFESNGRSPIKRITDYLAGRCRVLALPGKVDDLIINNGLTSQKLKMTFGIARRA